MTTFRPEEHDAWGFWQWRPNRHAGWATGRLPRDYEEAAVLAHDTWGRLQGALGTAGSLTARLERLEARSKRQTAHAARLERRVVRQRTALRDANEEISRLERWKAEATELLVQWDEVHDALGAPAQLGESKAAASLRRALEVRA